MKEDSKPKSEINLRKLMQKLGLGTNAFAEKCGMSSQSMSQFLRNKSLTTNTIYRIATALDIDPRDMFFPTDEKEEAEEREKALESAKNSKMPLELILRDLTRRAYPSITKEEADEWIEVIRKKNMVPWFDINPNQRGAQNAMDNQRRLEEARKEHEGEGMGARLTSVETGWLEGESALDAVLNGDNLQGNEPQGGTAKVETFCPHCGKRVRVGVVLLD